MFQASTHLFKRALLGFEQGLVLLLVLGRWFLPRGKMTRAKLSDMLFAFVGMSMDILEFLQASLAVSAISCDKSKSMFILFLTVVSLTQFTFDLDLFIGMYSMRKRRNKAKNDTEGEELGKLKTLLKNPEVRTILMTVFLQDFPFFCYRLYLLTFFSHDEDALQSLLFFMLKNVLVLALQGYRLWIILRNVEVSCDKLVKRIGKFDKKDDFELNKDFAISGEFVMTIKRKIEDGKIEKNNLIEHVQGVEKTGTKFRLDEDIDIGENLILTLREKTDEDQFEKDVQDEKCHDNKAFSIEEGK